MKSITAYHQRTKHSLQHGYARGPETLDWDDQPNAFRYFEGCPNIKLPAPGQQRMVSWSQIHANTVKPAELNLENLGLLLELSFGLSAWKQVGPDRWAVRNNPSSGNLHPTEAYLITENDQLLPAGVYHYVSHDHMLEQRCLFESHVVSNQLLIGLSSIHWREAWKYGERAYRYCQLDTGHAVAAIQYAAATLGWRVELVTGFSDDDIAQILGLNRTDDFVAKEYETAELICRINYNNEAEPTHKPDLLTLAEDGKWQGKARSLGACHVFDWPVIEQVSQATQKQPADTEYDPDAPQKWHAGSAQLLETDSTELAITLIRQRRSAQRFIPNMTAMRQPAFFRMLSALSVRNNVVLGSWPWAPAVHLCLFVHNVEGLAPGLYCLPRSELGINTLKRSMKPEFLWQPVAAFPQLYLLYQADVRHVAKKLSCHQAIAADGVFSLAMIAEFHQNIHQQAWYYRRLFWECGLLGQILYLEAEAVKYRGTGIGCFFDDDVHRILGIDTDELQSLYHFTVGEPFEDARIETLPAYYHLQSQR
ncbi:SagB/ThcOx family dehydrogenase [Methylophaga sp.]|uniref:SagB/ThcOx family dehydrogenase n=1 Tax=Methylophaga sp. TaxID=2024840 RepID=UPI00271AA1D1|nr:SagB/ThcOx family dehydrogenase [Methylophaga sp.]MDO8828061.1 SagB/ThcOx family dehydrogenase [Methylophaga sp.]